MEKSFVHMFAWEMTMAEHALLTALETLDRMRYTESAELQNLYMEKVGTFEAKVLEAELDAHLSRRKMELIQIAVNQRKPVDLPAIEKLLAEEREEKLNALARDTIPTAAVCSEEDAEALQTLYHQIVETFHPQVHALSETEKALYEKAMDAYRHQDLRTMELIWDMLHPDLPLEITIELLPDTPKPQGEAAFESLYDEVSVDYSLAETLYPLFRPTEYEEQFRNCTQQYNEKRCAVLAEIDDLRKRFPFSAEPMLRNEAQTERYLAELQLRLEQAQIILANAEKKILKMTGGAEHG